MGNWITRSRYRGLLNWFRRGEPRDATGLTEREKKALREVWQEFCCAYDDYGVLIFQSFIIKYPEHLNLFEGFRGRTMRTLSGDPQFRAHCTLVGNELTRMIESLDNPAELLELMRKLAVLHQRPRGVKGRYFTAFGHVAVDVLTANQKRHMTSVAKKACLKFFETMTRVVTQVFDEPAKAPTGTSKSSDNLAQGTAAKQSSPNLVAEPAVRRPSIVAADPTDGRASDSEPGQPLGGQEQGLESGTGASAGGAVTSGRRPSVFQETKTAPQGTSESAKELGEGASGLKEAKKRRAPSLRPEKTKPDSSVRSRRASMASTAVGKASSQLEPELDPKRKQSADSRISTKTVAGQGGSATVTSDVATVAASDNPPDSAGQPQGGKEQGLESGTGASAGRAVTSGRRSSVYEKKTVPQGTSYPAKELGEGASGLKEAKRPRAANLRPEKMRPDSSVRSRRASMAPTAGKASSQLEPELDSKRQQSADSHISTKAVAGHGGSATVTSDVATVAASDKPQDSAGLSAGVKEPGEDSAKRESVGGARTPFGRPTHITEGEKGPPQDTVDSAKELTRGASVLKRERMSRRASLRPEKSGSNATTPRRRSSKAGVVGNAPIQDEGGLNLSRQTSRHSSSSSK